MREGKHEHRNEIVFTLDGLLRQEDINRDEYTQLRNMSTESLGKEEEEMDVAVEDEFTKMIQSALDFIIQHDMKEVMEQSLKKMLPRIILTHFSS